MVHLHKMISVRDGDRKAAAMAMRRAA
jgi:hypothetical protein